jgi:Leucine-rich repeat (LRR) protein
MNKRHSDRVLDSKLAISLIGSESPNDLIINNEDITRVGNLCEVPFLRKLNISFNNILTLDGIDQLPQLRILYAYSCNLDNIMCLQTTSKLEQLFLQDNKISHLVPSFSVLLKLQHLRLDNNKITMIENLQNCSNLKVLDLSRNNISNIEPLNGLQNLSELLLNNNNIKSVGTLRGLPSLKELDLSHNQIKAVDFGVLAAQLPSLETINLNHNVIAMLVHTSVGSTSANTAANTKKKTKSVGVVQLPPTAELKLLELYLSGNRIKSLSALSSLHDSLEVLDISNNSFPCPPNPAAEELLNTVCKFTLLTELRMNNNDCCGDTEYMRRLVAMVTSACSQLTAVDGLSIVQGTREQPVSASRLQHDEQGDLALGFHTWPADSQSVLLVADDSTASSSVLRTASRSVYVHSDSDDSDAEEALSEEGKQVDTASRITDEVASDESRWRLKPMVSEAVIQQKEEGIRSLLGRCKDMLSLVTVFNVMNYEERDRQERMQAEVGSADTDAIVDIAPAVKSRVETLIDRYHLEQVQGQQQFVSDQDKIGVSSVAREPMLAVTESFVTPPIERATSSKSRRFAEHKEEGQRQDEALLSPRQQQDMVRIVMPRAEDMDNETTPYPQVPVVDPRPVYKPLMHSSVRQTTSSSSMSSTSLKGMAGIALDSVATLDDASVASSSARSTTSKDRSVKKTKPSKTAASTGSNLYSGGMSAAERFSSEIAKLGAPVGSGLSRHGTKTGVRQTAVVKQALVTPPVFSSGDSATALLLKSGVSGVGLASDTDSHQTLSGVRITKRDTRQHFLDGGNNMSVGAEEFATAKEDDLSGPDPQGKQEEALKNGEDIVDHSRSEAKSSGRFGRSFVALDPRAPPPTEDFFAKGPGATLFEKYHNMHVSSDSKLDSNMDSFSLTRPPQAPFALSLNADNSRDGPTSPLLLSDNSNRQQTGSSNSATSHREAFRVSASASIPQPVIPPNTYK